MASIDQIRTALAMYYDEELKPTLPEMKGRIFGFALGVTLAKPDAWLGRIIPIARAMGAISENGDVDVDLLAREAKKNLFGKDGVFEIRKNLNPLNPADIDIFRFHPADVDALMRYIERA